jgi:tetratricopeptide (TPR) repeat protein
MIKYSEKKALIIEDFAEFARAVSTMLRNIGIQYTDTVITGEAAIQACRETRYDIILSDYNLGPNKDGQQVLEELIEFGLIKPDCTFIMITAEKTAAMVMGAIEFQPDSYLTKPFNNQLLKVRLDKCISKNQILSPVKKLMQQSKWNDAAVKCDEIMEAFPKYRSVCLHRQFDCFKNSGQYDKALSLVNNILNERSTPWALKGLGSLYVEQEKLELARDTFKRMVTEFPMALDGYDWLAKIQHQLGNPIDAQATLEKAVSKSPKLIKRQKYLGQLAEINNDLEATVNAYRQAVKYGQHSAFSSPDEYVKLTKNLGKKLSNLPNEERNKIINEAEILFRQIENKFKGDSNTQFRGAVAHADFCSIIKDNKSVNKHLKSAQTIFDRVEEHLGADESIEIAESLKVLGLSQLAEGVLAEAVEQYFDDPTFIKQASKLTNNKHLIANANKANKLNNEAVRLFKQNEFTQAIEYFVQAAEIAPNNVNIRLNQSQALLKQYQSVERNPEYLHQSHEILRNITRLGYTDSRYMRFSELNRLNQLMLQKLD